MKLNIYTWPMMTPTNQLIELIESYGDTINLTRDLYIANVSLQLNDTMRILTIFSVILFALDIDIRYLWDEWIGSITSK
jgi:Mg2+ and Co2+ transporter CorA